MSSQVTAREVSPVFLDRCVRKAVLQSEPNIELHKNYVLPIYVV